MIRVRDRFEKAVEGYAGDRGVEKSALECCVRTISSLGAVAAFQLDIF